MPNRKLSADKIAAAALAHLPPDPDEIWCNSPKHVWLIRLMHDKQQVFDYVYATCQDAEAKVKRLFAEGVPDHLEIVKTSMVVCIRDNGTRSNHISKHKHYHNHL